MYNSNKLLKYKKILLVSLIFCVLGSGCAFDYRTPNRNEDCSDGVCGMKLSLKNSVEFRWAKNMDLNTKLCATDNTVYPGTPAQDQYDSSWECYSIDGTIVSGKTESFAIPKSDLERLQKKRQIFVAVQSQVNRVYSVCDGEPISQVLEKNLDTPQNITVEISGNRNSGNYYCRNTK